MSKAILDALYTRLSGATLGTTLSGRIYISEGPPDALLPLLVYATDSYQVAKVFGNQERHDLQIDFTFYQRNTGGTTIHTLRDQLETALASKLTPTGYDRCTFILANRGVPSFSDDSWTLTDRYRAIGFKNS